MKIGIVGLPSTGKTTLARALAGALHSHFEQIELLTEFARDYIADEGTPQDIWEQLLITNKQIERERRTASSQVTVTDSPVFLGLLYAGELYKGSEGVRHPLAMSTLFENIVKYCNESPYDYIIFLTTPAKVVDDGTRDAIQLTDAWRIKAASILDYLMALTKPYKTLIRVDETDLSTRLKTVLERIEQDLN